MADNTKSVNAFSSKYLCSLDPVLGPCARNLINSATVRIPNSDFGRWFLRTHFNSMSFTADAANWYSKNDPSTFQVSELLTKVPHVYQRLALFRMALSNCGLWLDMGLGKTFISIAFALWCFERKLANTFLVICPLSVFVTWEDEINDSIVKSAGIKPYIIYGKNGETNLVNARINSESNKPTFIVTNYESVPKIYAELQKINIGVIYLDESSRIKNPETKRTKNIMAFRHSFPKARRFCLSGTPSTKTPLGYYSQLEFLNYGYSDSESYFMFQRKYCTTGLFAKARLPNGREIFFRNDSLDDQLTWLQENYLPNSNQSYHQAGYFFTQKRSHVNPLAIPILHCFNRIFGYKNLDQLHQIHQTHAYTLKKQDVLKELPSKTYTIRKLEMTDEQRKAIDAIRKKHKLDVNGLTFNFADRNSPFATLHTIANGFIYGDDKKPIWFKEQPKLDEISNFIEELGDKKLIIWSAYPAQIEQIHTYLKEKMDRKSVMLYGGTRPEDRPGVLHEFQQDTDYLVANPEVGGLGLNLTVAYTELFASTWCKPDTRIQAEDRCHRIGQLNNVLIADIVVKGTVEIGILRNSKKEIDIENQIIKIKDLTDTLADHLGA